MIYGEFANRELSFGGNNVYAGAKEYITNPGRRFACKKIPLQVMTLRGKMSA